MPHGHSSSAPPLRTSRRAADLLHEARGRERAGCIPEAMACYESAIAAAEKSREHAVLAEALRRLALGGQSRELWARVEQNLGILANIQGELYEALTRYGRSLEAYRGAGDEHGCAIAYHNLGMVSADRQLYDEADRYFGERSSTLTAEFISGRI